MSRMAVIDARTRRRAKPKRNTWIHGGDLQAELVKALPTDEELSKVKCSDGALFLRLLEKKNLGDEILPEFANFRRTHSIASGGHAVP
jgi:hypothetical protein